MSEVDVIEGRVLSGKFRVLQRIGAGGMGVVYAAQHLLLDERVAIKFLSTAALNAEAVARFEREARAAAKIKSEHVVRMLDVGYLESGAPYMVMEFLDGEELGEYLRRVGPLAVDVAVDFVLQACIAMADAHAAGIVHRDLKPSNLFCVQRSDGTTLIKVLDFGISKQTRASGEAMGDSITRTGTMLGSPLYMSPEQMRQARNVDTRTDIWSLGVVLFELLAGSVPFSATAYGELAIKIATEPAPELRSLRAEVPRALQTVVETCLQKEREHRPANVAELATLLLPFAAEPSRPLVARVNRIVQGGASVAPRGSSCPPPELASNRTRNTEAAWAATREARTSPWALLAGVTLLATLAAIGWFSHQGPAPVRPPLAEASVSGAAITASAVRPTAPPESSPSPVLAIKAEPSPAAPAPKMTRTPRRLHDVEASATRGDHPPKKADSASSAACDPPYTVDAFGRKRFKQSCFINSQP
jgi:serine/threonine protein kinase